MVSNEQTELEKLQEVFVNIAKRYVVEIESNPEKLKIPEVLFQALNEVITNEPFKTAHVLRSYQVIYTFVFSHAHKITMPSIDWNSIFTTIFSRDDPLTPYESEMRFPAELVDGNMGVLLFHLILTCTQLDKLANNLDDLFSNLKDTSVSVLEINRLKKLTLTLVQSGICIEITVLNKILIHEMDAYASKDLTIHLNLAAQKHILSNQDPFLKALAYSKVKNIRLLTPFPDKEHKETRFVCQLIATSPSKRLIIQTSSNFFEESTWEALGSAIDENIGFMELIISDAAHYPKRITNLLLRNQLIQKFFTWRNLDNPPPFIFSSRYSEQQILSALAAFIVRKSADMKLFLNQISFSPESALIFLILRPSTQHTLLSYDGFVRKFAKHLKKIQIDSLGIPAISFYWTLYDYLRPGLLKKQTHAAIVDSCLNDETATVNDILKKLQDYQQDQQNNVRPQGDFAVMVNKTLMNQVVMIEFDALISVDNLARAQRLVLDVKLTKFLAQHINHTRRNMLDDPCLTAYWFAYEYLAHMTTPQADTMKNLLAQGHLTPDDIYNQLLMYIQSHKINEKSEFLHVISLFKKAAERQKELNLEDDDYSSDSDLPQVKLLPAQERLIQLLNEIKNSSELEQLITIMDSRLILEVFAKRSWSDSGWSRLFNLMRNYKKINLTVLSDLDEKCRKSLLRHTLFSKNYSHAIVDEIYLNRFTAYRSVMQVRNAITKFKNLTFEIWFELNNYFVEAQSAIIDTKNHAAQVRMITIASTNLRNVGRALQTYYNSNRADINPRGSFFHILSLLHKGKYLTLQAYDLPLDDLLANVSRFNALCDDSFARKFAERLSESELVRVKQLNVRQYWYLYKYVKIPGRNHHTAKVQELLNNDNLSLRDIYTELKTYCSNPENHVAPTGNLSKLIDLWLVFESDLVAMNQADDNDDNVYHPRI